MFYVYKYNGIPVIENEPNESEELIGIRATMSEAQDLCDDCLEAGDVDDKK